MSVEHYKAVRNTIDVVILTTVNKDIQNERSVPKKGIQVLLVKRDSDPYNNMWTIPGGFVDYEKSISQTVREKLKQKTGIDSMYIEQLYTYGEDIHRDPRDRVISIGYIALTTKNNVGIINAHGEKETAWFWVNTVRDSKSIVTDAQFIKDGSNEIITDLGFDHKKIIIDAINRLSNKIMYTDIGFKLVSEEFTIKELENSFETILGKPIPGFRRMIMHKLEATGNSTKTVNNKPDLHRPAQLFRMKQEEI